MAISPILSIIIPTFNECDNVPLLVDRLKKALGDLSYSIIFVDDNSPDKTYDVVESLMTDNPHIQLIRRVGRKGLSSAVIEGVLLARSEYILVIDGDGQHDETIIPAMLEAAKTHDVVVGSRYCWDKGIDDWDKNRERMSRFATWLAQKTISFPITDPMSGFFLMRRSLILGTLDRLYAKGFKILLDILSVLDAQKVRMTEVPYTFRSRLHGDSKLSASVTIQFLEFLYERSLGRLFPLAFFKFALVGAIGTLVHLMLFFLFKHHFQYSLALLMAIEITLVLNYVLHNMVFSWGEKLNGIATKFVSYQLISGIGGAFNFIMNLFLYSHHVHWVIATLLGAWAGALWNYHLNRVVTWKKTS